MRSKYFYKFKNVSGKIIVEVWKKVPGHKSFKKLSLGTAENCLKIINSKEE